MTIFIASKFRQPIQEAWDESEGWYYCAEHFNDFAWDLPEGYRLAPVTAGLMVAEVLSKGQCVGCWEVWADEERIRYETDAVARSRWA